MNDRNKKLFFDDENEYTATITITDEENNQIEAEIIASVEIEELDREFVALIPTDNVEGLEENEALILEYSENKKGEPVFTPLEDDEIFEVVSNAFDQFFADMAEEDDDEEDEEESEDYLDDIGNMIPGVSIKKS